MCRSGEAEDAEEGSRVFLVAGGNRAPFLPPRSEVLDKAAVRVDPGRASDRRIGALGRDRGTCPHVPDAVAEGVGGEATIRDDRAGRIGQATKQAW